MTFIENLIDLVYLTSTQIAESYYPRGETYNKSEVYAKTDNIFEVQKIRAMSADFPNIADAVFFYDGIMESYFEFKAPNIYNKTEIDSTLTNYTTTTQLNNGFYSKSQTNVILQDYYGKAETNNLLANKLSKTGNLDVTASRIRCINNVGGRTGHFELKMSSSSDAFLNLTTSYGGWLHFSVNDNNYFRLSGSDNQINIYKHTTLSYDLDVGVNSEWSKINVYAKHTNGVDVGILKLSTHSIVLSSINYTTTASYGTINFEINGVNFFRITNWNNQINFYKTFTGTSDDRLKENEVITENACETLSKLRPQIYDKKPDMENNDPTTWIKESGLIAQEIYYDAPELRHLVYRGRPEFDEEGNEIPLPEIPTSIDPQQDPDYSSWGKDTASVNYIGLIAYLVKANTELHERVKVLEAR